MATVEITCPGIQALITRLEAIKDALPAALGVANETIKSNVETALPAIYTPRLAKYWIIDTSVTDEAALASVRVWTESKYLYGYEFPIRPHPINPKTVRVGRKGGVLAWSSGGATTFATHVNWPGTPGHNRRELLIAALSDASRSAWTEAINGVLGA